MRKLFILILLLQSVNSIAQTDLLVANQPLTFQQSSILPTTSQDFYMPPPRGGNCVNGFTVTGNILAAIGGGLIGWPLGTAIGGGDPEWILAGIGAGVLAVAIPLAVIGQKRCSGGRYGALQQSNTDYTVMRKTKELGFVAKGNTIGLQLSF